MTDQRSYDDEGPMTRDQAEQRRAAEWALTHSLADAKPDPESTAHLQAHLPPPPTEPVTAESTDAMLVTTSLRIPLGTQRRLQAYADAHAVKPTALMRQWIEQMLAAVENDRPISLQDAIRALAQLTPPTTGSKQAA